MAIKCVGFGVWNEVLGYSTYGPLGWLRVNIMRRLELLVQYDCPDASEVSTKVWVKPTGTKPRQNVTKHETVCKYLSLYIPFVVVYFYIVFNSVLHCYIFLSFYINHKTGKRSPIVIQLSWWRHQMETFFRVAGPLCGEFTCDAELWCFLWSAPE